MPISDCLETNRQSWNQRTDVHIASAFYDNESFLKGRNTLTEIEMPLLGNVNGKSILHLQCHFGQDTISLSRLGAQVTGIDLSDKAIERAQQFATETDSSAQFIWSNVYDLPQHLHQPFDIIFTSYGTIGWLPDLDKWAAVIATFLKPGGRFVFAEFHPFVWAFDDDFREIKYSYFNVAPIVENETGTYTDRNAPIKQQTITWNHPISEVVTSLISNGLQIQVFNEYNYSPYNCFRHTVEVQPGKFRIAHFEDKFPMVYALVASKNI